MSCKNVDLLNKKLNKLIINFSLDKDNNKEIINQDKESDKYDYHNEISSDNRILEE